MLSSEEVTSILINLLEYWCWHPSDPEGILFYKYLSDLKSDDKVYYSVLYNKETTKAIRVDFCTKENDSTTRFASVCLLFTADSFSTNDLRTVLDQGYSERRKINL